MPHQVAVVGAGPAGLMAAEVLLAGGARVTLFDRMASPGRKLLLAGRGGLNLTHSEDRATFLARYGDARGALASAIEKFGPQALRDWCAGLGIDTFVGSSERVFPSSFKTSPLLRAWLRRLAAAGLRVAFQHRWIGWDAHGALRFATREGEIAFDADVAVLALGGASWPQLGSDGGWADTLRDAGFYIAPLQPANCGFVTDWSATFRERFEGEPLKNVALGCGSQTARGDAMVTRAGIEGGPVYALAGLLRTAIAADGAATLAIALRPDLPEAAIAARLAKRRPKESLANALRKTLGLAPVAIGLLRESGAPLADLAPDALAQLINAVPIRVSAPMPIARAISTAGGVRFADCDAALMLRPGLFVAGEMLDWEAPTGGYLLQACFATGVAAGDGALAWLARDASSETDARSKR